ncbi:MAG: AMP-binding protein [Candidatus Omnitrophota bacterium]
MKVKQLLEDRALVFAQKPAVIFKNNIITFSQLRDNVFKLVDALKACGVSKGDKVAIFLPNCPEYVYSYLALFSLGAVVVPLDFMLKIDELTACLDHSETKFLIAKQNNDVLLRDVQNNVSSLSKIIVLGEEIPGTISFERIVSSAKAQAPAVDVNDQDPSLIMYTSGTTGKPKGILLNYRHLNGSPKAMEHFVDLSDKDVKLSALPLSHIAGLIYIQNCLMFGITLILMERFHPVEFLKNVEQYKVTCFHVVPAMYTAFLMLKEIEKFNLSSLRWIVVFGAPSSPELLRRFHQYCPNARFLNGWGMTETCPPNTVTPLGSDKIESVGKPSPHCEIKIVNENDIEVKSTEIGEVVIRGWVVMDGYYKDPETNKELIRNGWFHTGDLGRFDQEGYLYIVGRKKEMIKVGGQIVYAPEVEAALHKHAAVFEVAVVGIPDQLRGEAVKAFVSLKEKGSVSAEDLRYFAREHLAHFKVPHEIEILDVLPKNRTGKIDKELLKRGLDNVRNEA